AFGIEFNRFIDGLKDSMDEVVEKFLAIPTRKFCRQPSVDVAFKRRLVSPKPPLQINSVQYLRRIFEIRDGAEYREQMRLILWPNCGKFGLIVSLQEVGCYVTTRNLRIVKSQQWVLNRTPNHLVGIREVVLIM